MQFDHIILGDCVPYGIRTGVNESQTFASLIAAMRGATVKNLAYYYGTVGVVSSHLPTNPNNGVENTCLGQLDTALSYSPKWIFAMPGEASLYRDNTPADPPVESQAQFLANYRTLAQRCKDAGVTLVPMTIVPQSLADPVVYGTYYATDVVIYNEIIHQVAKEFGLDVVDVHDHMAAAMLYRPDLGASWFDTDAGTHNHLQPLGHQFVASLLNRAQYAHIGVVPQAPVISHGSPDMRVSGRINFSGSSYSVGAGSLNIASVSKLADGQVRVNFTTALVDANYAPSINAAPPGGNYIFFPKVLNTSYIDVGIRALAGGVFTDIDGSFVVNIP